MSRKVVIYTTNGGGKTIETEAKTWGELKAQLTKTGINPSGMKAADNKKRSYENGEAELPADLTHMFLLPVKTKSGAGDLSFSDARAFISNALAADESAAKAHFNQGGRNYTQKSTAVLNELIASYKPKGAKKTSAKTAKAEPAPKAAATKAVAKAKPAKAEEAAKPERVSRTVAKAKVAEKSVPAKVTKEVAAPKKATKAVVSSSTGNEIDGIVEILEGLTGYNQGAVNKAVMAVLELKVITEDAIDNSELNRMARDIASGFSDVKSI